MALDNQYHCSIKPISRSAGRSAVAAAAYRSGILLRDNRTELDHDFRRKRGIVLSEILAPPGCDWARDRARLWNAVESSKAMRANGRAATEVECALPAALSSEQRAALVRRFAESLIADESVAVDYSVHAPHPNRRPRGAAAGADLPGDDSRNFHVHILVSHLLITPNGPSKPVSKLFDGPQRVEAIRQRWAEHVNAAYAAAGLDLYQDARSYATMGIDRVPTRHLGAATIAQERRGRPTERGDMHRARTEHRRAGLALTALDGEQDRREQGCPPMAITESVCTLTMEQKARRAEGYKNRLLSSRYGPFDDFVALAAAVRRLDLECDDGPRVFLRDGGKITDHGDRLSVHGAWRGQGQGRADPTDAAVAALVTLARAKGWQSITLYGSEDFQSRAARFATRVGLSVSNDTLRHVIADEQRRMQAQQSIAGKNAMPAQPINSDTAIVNDTARAAVVAQQSGDSRTLAALCRATPDHLRRRVGDLLHHRADAEMDGLSSSDISTRMRSSAMTALAREWDRIENGITVTSNIAPQMPPEAAQPIEKRVVAAAASLLAARRAEATGGGDSFDTLRAERTLSTILDRMDSDQRAALLEVPRGRDREPALSALLEMAVTMADSRADARGRAMRADTPAHPQHWMDEQEETPVPQLPATPFPPGS